MREDLMHGRWPALALGLALCLAGCASRPVSPDPRQEAVRSFSAVQIWKPSATALASPLAMLPPFILAETGSGFTQPMGLAMGSGAAVEATTNHSVVYVHSDTLALEGRAHARVTDWWVSAAGSAMGLRLTLNSAGAPVLWEVADHRWPRQLVFVARSLETAAAAAFGEPLPGRAVVIERSAESAPHTTVVRILEDGPVPMGPMVYVAGTPPEVASVICRCMPAQAVAVAGMGEFEVEIAEPLVRLWLARRGVELDAGLWPTRFDSLDKVLRLPPDF
jgi:hypothetical protein